MDNRNDTEDDWVADVESDIPQGNGIDDLEFPEQWAVSAAPNLLGLIRPTWKTKRQADNVFMTLNAIQMMSNQGLKKQ